MYLYEASSRVGINSEMKASLSSVSVGAGVVAVVGAGVVAIVGAGSGAGAGVGAGPP